MCRICVDAKGRPCASWKLGNWIEFCFCNVLYMVNCSKIKLGQRQCPDNRTLYEVPRAHNQIISASMLLSLSVVRTRNGPIKVFKF